MNAALNAQVESWEKHPDEHPLELTMEHLLELRGAVEAMDEPAIEVHDDFIVYPL